MNSTDGEIAFQTSLKSKVSKWPERGSQNRLFPACAPEISPSFHFERGESVFTIGSCFARNVEVALKESGFVVPCADFTVPETEFWPNAKTSHALNKFSPFSMLNELRFAFEPTLRAEDFLVEDAVGMFADYQLHVRGNVLLERALERRNQVRDRYQSGLKQSRVVIITLGMSEAWFDTKYGIYVNDNPSHNMVRLYPGRFEFRVLEYPALYECVDQTVQLLQRVCPNVKIMLTVSPVPLHRTFTSMDVITANTYSKSVLRAASGAIAAKYDFVDYFPSYESVIFSAAQETWNDDQLHVKLAPIRRIVGSMMESYTRR
ncbi:MAG: GSCFA domain-containing protein [Xanthobacteraceae bacterium]|nr:GSCFA domain-containing protein [Xanthobacteraceae bacterium]